MKMGKLRTPHPLILIASLTFAVYLNALSNGFVFDDTVQIVKNPNLASLSWVKGAFFHVVSFGEGFNRVNAFFYRPLFWVSLALDAYVWGLDPFGYHFTNVLLHTLAALLVFSLVRRLWKDETLAVLASLLWAVHPLHTETVTYIAGRAAPLCVFFYLLGLNLFFHEAKVQWERAVASIGAVLAFTLALLSYELAVSFPLVIALLDILRAPHRTGPEKRLQWAFRFLPFVLVLALYFLLRFLFLPFGGPMTLQGLADGWGSRLLAIPPNIARYLTLLLFPIQLRLHRSEGIAPPAAPLDPVLLLSLLVIIVLLAVAWKVRASWPMASAGILWFFLTFLPVSNLVPVYIPFAERFMYLPSIGAAIASVALGRALLRRLAGPCPGGTLLAKAVVVAFVLVLVLFSARTILRNRDYQDDETLYKATLAASPENALIRVNFRVNLGNTYLREGRLELAEEQFREALKQKPDPSALNSLAVVHLKQGRLDLAKVELEEALKLDPRSFVAHANLGLIHRQEGHLDLALTAFQRAVALSPGHVGALTDLGRIYLALGKQKEAASLFKRVLTVQPGFPPAEAGLKEAGESLVKEP